MSRNLQESTRTTLPEPPSEELRPLVHAFHVFFAVQTATHAFTLNGGAGHLHQVLVLVFVLFLVFV